MLLYMAGEEKSNQTYRYLYCTVLYCTVLYCLVFTVHIQCEVEHIDCPCLSG